MPSAVSDIFDIRYGHSLELNALKLSNPQDGIAFVSRQMGQNGISAYVEPIQDIDPAPAGDITCALSGNGVLTTCLQESPFYTAFHVAILRPKVNLTKQQIIFYCLCIKTNRFRYNYGRQANKTLSSLSVPTLGEIPQWVSATALGQIDGADASLNNAKPAEIETADWSEFRYDALFKIKRGLGPRKSSLSEQGSTPFVTSTDRNNGLTGYTTEAARHSGNVITVNRNGSVAEAFYQAESFSSTEDVHVFNPKFPLNKYIAMFIVSLIRMEKYRFSYGRKWGLERMNESIIRLPVKSSGEPDWAFIENYIKSLQQKHIEAGMVEKPNAPRGRPIKNEIDQIPASAEQIAGAIFRAAEKKKTTAKPPKPKRKKPN